MTKAAAIARVLKERGGSATLQTIYDNIERHYPAAKAAPDWRAGIRGVVYREIRNGRTLEKTGPATYKLTA
jgi:hypothetical protein